MKTKDIIRDLKRSNILTAECPTCGGEFKLSTAALFDPSQPLPAKAQAFRDGKASEFQERTQQLQEALRQLRQRKLSVSVASERQAAVTGLGSIMEKLVIGWAGFPHQPNDCRALYEPIDYVAFDNLTGTGAIEQIAFMDVKTGEAKLNPRQRSIKDAVQRAKVEYREL